LVLACLALVLIVGVVYGRVARHAFVDYDDTVYVSENEHVRAGLSLDFAVWAFSTGTNSNWHPLTWLSHALDVELFGLDPTGHHLVSVGLHASNAVLLLLALHAMTGALWRSAAVAALFALHPQHVESVAWVAERKDVLCTLFGLLALLAYVRHVARPAAATRALVLLLFAASLLAKPMLVTLPFVLLLLDVWPLGRRGEGARRLIVEKLPLFALATASSAVTWFVQQRGGAVTALDALPLHLRLENALVAYATYLGKTFWPTGLGVLYPLHGSLPAWKVAGAGLLLAAITGAVAALGRRAPYLATGWLWYLGTLVPVIGIVQVGAQSGADRYTYIPLVGVFLMLAWGLTELLGARPHGRAALAAIAAAALAGCALLTWRQAGTWRDSETLFEHTLAVTERNHIIENNLGGALMRQGRIDEALRHFENSRRIRPDHAPALSNLGVALQRKGRWSEAIALYREALKAKPGHLEAWLNLGNALEQTGDPGGALAAFREADRLKPGDPEIGARLRAASALERRPATAPPAARASYAMGNAARVAGRLDEAESAYREAVRLDPGWTAARNNLGIALALRGAHEEAALHFDEVLRLDPRDATAHYNLGVLLARRGLLREAIVHYEAALRITPGYADAKRALADARRRAAAAPER
jgi:tetratricopeptide (TPR) repeat protein